MDTCEQFSSENGTSLITNKSIQKRKSIEIGSVERVDRSVVVDRAKFQQLLEMVITYRQFCPTNLNKMIVHYI